VADFPSQSPPRSTPPLPRIAITTGDPGGIGPEVIVKALADVQVRNSARFVLLGPAAALEHAARDAQMPPCWQTATLDSAPPAAAGITLLDYPLPMQPLPQATAEQGDLSFRLVEDAIALAQRPTNDPLHVQAVVTGPISKHAWQLAGRDEFPGHTELFAARFGVPRHAMMFITTRPPHLRVILATAHLPLMQVGRALTTHRVTETIELGHQACQRLSIPAPRIAVCGLNPHAGEAGILGTEDGQVIAPAIKAANAAGIAAHGPFPADTVYNAALRGDYDLVVAMYHDQGLIPIKLLARDSAVNLTVGLPIIRTSPDHGTAFDIAGATRADPGSMRAAIQLAVQMTSAR
jgi:4-phospho-D-threonate 3-dehydrogenase / 4-phospho-D-erythronate 3-dehydrogenase